MTECPNCHATLADPPDRFCPNCGADLVALGFGGAPPPVPADAPAPPPLPVEVASGGWPPPSPPGGTGGGWGSVPPGGSTPWERRAQLGFLNALIETTKQVLSAPTDFFRSMPVTGGLGAPLLYAVIIGYIGWLAASIYNAVFRAIVGSSLADMGTSSELQRLAPFLEGGASLVANVIFGPVLIVIGLFLVAGILHVVLLLLGGAGRGFEGTFRVVAYGHAASIFNIVPGCGGLIVAVYTLVLLVIGLSEAHGISRGRAAAAVLIPFVVLCCCCGAALGMAIFGAAGALGRMN